MKYEAPKNLVEWSRENLAKLAPPIANAALYPDSDYILNVVGGPNIRSDFHDNPGEEVFYQLEGHAHLLIWDRGQFEKIDLKPGDVFLLPAHLQHSPQRQEKGLCFLIERPRPEGDFDYVRWYCSNCATEIYKAGGQLQDLTKDLPILFAQYYALDDAARTCPQCGRVHPGKKAEDWLTEMNSSKAANFKYNYRKVEA